MKFSVSHQKNHEVLCAYDIPHFILFRVFLFFFPLEREHTWAGVGRAEGGGERESQADAPTKHRAQCRAWSHDPGIMTWAEINSQMLNWPSHPGAPIFFIALHRYCVFDKLKVCGNTYIEQVYWWHFPISICSLHVSVSCVGNSCNISNIFIIIIFVMVICDWWSLMLL